MNLSTKAKTKADKKGNEYLCRTGIGFCIYGKLNAPETASMPAKATGRRKNHVFPQ